jgi:hypothetical protein
VVTHTTKHITTRIKHNDSMFLSRREEGCAKLLECFRNIKQVLGSFATPSQWQLCLGGSLKQ